MIVGYCAVYVDHRRPGLAAVYCERVLFAGVLGGGVWLHRRPGHAAVYCEPVLHSA